jgi:hypothetical protein
MLCRDDLIDLALVAAGLLIVQVFSVIADVHCIQRSPFTSITWV